MIERGEPWLAQPLRDRENRAIDKADFEISVGTQQLVRALVVGGRQILYYESAAPDLIEDGGKRLLACETTEKMIDLNEDRRGNHAPLLCALNQGCTRRMCGVASIKCSDENAGVENQRNGGGSYTSRLASSLKSLRPDSNMPIQVTG